MAWCGVRAGWRAVMQPGAVRQLIGASRAGEVSASAPMRMVGHVQARLVVPKAQALWSCWPRSLRNGVNSESACATKGMSWFALIQKPSSFIPHASNRISSSGTVSLMTTNTKSIRAGGECSQVLRGVQQSLREHGLKGFSTLSASLSNFAARRFGESRRQLNVNPLDRWQFRENSFWGEQVLYLIIGLNVLVYVFWQNVNLRRFMTDHFTVSTVGVLREGRFHTCLTSVFSHHGLGHLAANMLTLWFFGAEAIALLGARRFLQLYLGGGLVSSVCQVLWPLVAPHMNIPARNRNSTRQMGLGASGAVNSVVALSILIAPSRTILLYFFLPVPSAVLGCIFLGKDLAGLYYGDNEYGNAAHLGGTLFGGLFWMMLRRQPFHY